MTRPARIKVVHIVEDLDVGGMERVIQAIAEGLPREKYDVSVLCLTRGGPVAEELSAAGVKVEIAGMKGHCSACFLLKLQARIRDMSPDIVHVHGYSATEIGRIAALLAGVPHMVSHMHSTYWDFSRKKLLVERALSFATDRILCCSGAVADFVVSAEKIRPGKVSVVYNGAKDMGGGEREGARARLRIAAGDFVVLVPASLVKHKGHACFLAAFSEVRALLPSAKAIFAGEGPLRGELEARAGQLGLAGSVLFAGLCRDMRSMFAAADIVVLPSVEREGISLAILEAMSAGLPVVGTRLGGIPEAVDEGNTGLLAEAGNVGELSSAILKIAGDGGLRTRMGLAGRKRYESMFTKDGMLSRIGCLYDELAGKR